MIKTSVSNSVSRRGERRWASLVALTAFFVPAAFAAMIEWEGLSRDQSRLAATQLLGLDIELLVFGLLVQLMGFAVVETSFRIKLAAGLACVERGDRCWCRLCS